MPTVKNLLVKIADGASFTTVAGLRTWRLAFNAETVDITHAESANRWRELLDGAGVKRASVSGRGLFKDASADALMREIFFDGAVVSYQIVIPTFGTVEGPFQITSLEFAGEHNGEVTYDMSLELAGELTFTAVPPTKDAQQETSKAMVAEDKFEGMSGSVTALCHEIEKAIIESGTFQVLISQSGNNAPACARDIARDIEKTVRNLKIY